MPFAKLLGRDDFPAADIAAQLQETHPPAILQIRRIVEQIGMEAAYVCLQKALAVEAEGGMLTADNKQRRTPGGTYFYLSLIHI